MPREVSASCSRPCGERVCEKEGSWGCREGLGVGLGTFLTPLSLPREHGCRYLGRWLGRICLPMRRGGMHDWPCSWAWTGFSGVLPSPTNSLSRKGPIRANRGGRPAQESSRGSTDQVHTQLRPQTRVRTRPRMAGKDQRMSPVCNAFTIVCRHPGASPSARAHLFLSDLTLFSCLMISIG